MRFEEDVRLQVKRTCYCLKAFSSTSAYPLQHPEGPDSVRNATPFYILGMPQPVGNFPKNHFYFLAHHPSTDRCVALWFSFSARPCSHCQSSHTFQQAFQRVAVDAFGH